jgi:hypothetical protein
MHHFKDRPCAALGLTSYRYRGDFGWIMIGAKDNDDALRESLRSTPSGGDIARLEVWNGTRYLPAMPITEGG